MGEMLTKHMMSEHEQEISDDTKKMVVQMSRRYKTAYSYGLLQQLRMDMSGEAKETYLLSKRKWLSYNRYLLSGPVHVLDDNEHRKWRRRFCVLQADYTLEVHDSEEDFAAANKPRFSCKYSSFKVIDNVDAHINQTIKDAMRDFGYVTQNVASIAKKLGSIADSSKRPTQHVLGLYHPYRGKLLIAVDTAVEKDKWLNSLRDSARQLQGVHCENEIVREAFEFAIGQACMAEEYCDVQVSLCGTQVQIVTDFITDYLANGCKTMLQTKMKGSVVDKYKMWVMIKRKLVTMVESIVETDYPPLRKKAEEEANQLRSTMMVSMSQIVSSYDTVSSHITDGIEANLRAEIEENILFKLPELLSKMADAMLSCLREVKNSFIGLVEGVQLRVSATSTEFANNIDRYFLQRLDYSPRNPEEMRTVFQSVFGNKSPISNLLETFPKVDITSHRNKLCVILQKLLDSAVYTFEKLCGETVLKNGGRLQITSIAKTQGRVLKRLDHDSIIITKQYLRDVILAVVYQMTRYTVANAFKHKMHEFEDLIPLEYSEFMPIANVFKEIVSNNLLSDIKPALAAAMKSLTSDSYNMDRCQSNTTLNSHSSNSDEPAKNEVPSSQNSSQEENSLSHSVSKMENSPIASMPKEEEQKENENVIVEDHELDDEQVPEEQNQQKSPDQEDSIAQTNSFTDGETGEMFKPKDDDETESTSNEEDTTVHATVVSMNGHHVEGSKDDRRLSSDTGNHEQVVNGRALSPGRKREGGKKEFHVADRPNGDENSDVGVEHSKEYLQAGNENVGSSVQDSDEQECSDEESKSDRGNSEIEFHEISAANGTTVVAENDTQKEDVNMHMKISHPEQEQMTIGTIERDQSSSSSEDSIEREEQHTYHGVTSSTENQDDYELIQQSPTLTPLGENSRRSEDAVNGPPVPAPRKNRPAIGASGSHHSGECNTNHSNVRLESRVNDKNNGVLEQIIQTGEEKLI